MAKSVKMGKEKKRIGFNSAMTIKERKVIKYD